MRKNQYSSFGALIEAASNPADEFENDIAPITNPIVKAALAEQKAGQLKEVKDQIILVLAQAKAIRDTKVSAIRQLRKEVDMHKKALNHIDNAEAHGMQTGDFRPLLSVLGVRIEDFDATKWLI